MISLELNNALAEKYATSEQTQMFKKAIDFNALAASTQDMINKGTDIDCCVVYSDISNFSTIVSNKSANYIREFLEAYYAKVIPLVYAHGGLIDQIIGDGIISVYAGELRCTNNNVFAAGLLAAKSIVSECAGDENFSTKCALHKEKAILCNVGSKDYKQPTIVGNIMTVVHRVESVARDEAVNMLYTIPEARKWYNLAKRNSVSIPNKLLFKWGTFSKSLKGIEPYPDPAKIIYVKYET